MSLARAIVEAVEGREVPSDLLAAAFDEIVGGGAPEAAVAGLLVALRCKGETVAEIVAVARTLRAHSNAQPAPDPRTVDTCGTGGDGADTFNISTAAAFVVAGTGVPVAKHGNRAITSRSGSIDVLEALGVRADLPVERSVELLRTVGVAPFFARRAHPAIRHVGPVREALGVRTLMNALGPLLNPVGVRYQLVGVYDAGLVVPLAHALGQLGARRVLVVHGADGLDEISVTAETFAALWDEGEVRSLTMDATDVGLARAPLSELRGGRPAVNADRIREVLSGKPGPARDIVVANAGAALWVASAARDWRDGVEQAARSIDSGAASDRLAELARATQATKAEA